MFPLNVNVQICAISQTIVTMFGKKINVVIHYRNGYIFSVVIMVAMYTIIININIGHMVHKHWSHGSLS